MISPAIPMHGTPEQLAESGGIYYFESPRLGDDHARSWINVMGVELPTQASQEQVEAVKETLVLSELDAKMLRNLAETRSLRQPILLESDPASGKTFLTEKFLELLNGDQPLLTMTGTPRTSDHEVLGHYSPLEDGWKFIKGSLLEAAVGDDSSGRPLFVDEFGLIPTNYQQLFLPISGQDGTLASSMSVWGNGNKQRYGIGPNAWFAFATNYPERTPGRHMVTDAMASRLVWMTITDAEAAAKEKSLIESGFGRVQRASDISAYSTPEETPFEVAANPELAQLITGTVAAMHSLIKLRAKNPGDSLGTGESAEPRIQAIDITPRDAARLFNYIERFPVRDHVRGQVDIDLTLSRAFERHYVGRYASEDQRQLIRADLAEHLTGSTGAKTINARLMNRSDQFKNAQVKRIPSDRKSTVTMEVDSPAPLSTLERQQLKAETASLAAQNQQFIACMQARSIDTSVLEPANTDK